MSSENAPAEEDWIVRFTCTDCDQVIRFRPAKRQEDYDRKQLAVMTLMGIRAHRRAVHQDALTDWLVPSPRMGFSPDA